MTGRAGSLPAALPGTPQHPWARWPPTAGGARAVPPLTGVSHPGAGAAITVCPDRKHSWVWGCHMGRGRGAACTGGFGGASGWAGGVAGWNGHGEGVLRCGHSGGILVALWLMLAVLDVAVDTEPSLGGHTGGLPFWKSLLGDCASTACHVCVCTRFCRGFCALFVVTVGRWLGQLCPTPAVFPRLQPWPPRLCPPPAPLLLALGMV